jgi:threonine/homoserine/homoserine lactone efflux protein
MSIEFLVTALVVVLIPGTGVVYTVATGLVLGRQASAFAALGCTLGIVPALAAAILGLAAVLHASALLFQVVKICGVVYLLYLAWQMLNSSGPLSLTDKAPAKRDSWGIARTGALINVLNPKLSGFFLAFLPQFVDSGASGATVQIAWLGGVFMAMTFVIFVLYGQFAAFAGDRVLRSETAMRWVRRSAAAAFAGFGVKLALSDR